MENKIVNKINNEYMQKHAEKETAAIEQKETLAKSNNGPESNTALNETDQSFHAYWLDRRAQKS